MAQELSWISACVGAAPATAVAVFGWLSARQKGKADVVSGQAALVKAQTDAAIASISDLRAEIAALRDDAIEDRTRIAALEAQLAAERKSRQDERHELASRAAKAEAALASVERRTIVAVRVICDLLERCTLGDGERRNLQQQFDSLLRIVRAEGLNVPAPPDRRTEPVILGDPAT